MIDEIENDEIDMTLPDFLDRSNPEVIAIVEKGRQLTLDARKSELKLGTAPKAAQVAARTEQKASKAVASTPTPAPVAEAKSAKVTSSKKSDAEMIALIKEHREAAGNTAGKTLKFIRALGISCSQERFKGLYSKA